MKSSMILIENLKKHFKTNSLRSLSKKINYSSSIILNWSSGRSFPSLYQLENIAFCLGIEVSELLIENNVFSVETPIWRDNVHLTLTRNLGKLRLEKDIRESYFNSIDLKAVNMSYRAFLRYVNGKNKGINLNILDNLSKIFEVKISDLIESERRI